MPIDVAGLTTKKHSFGLSYFIDGEKLLSISKAKEIVNKPYLINWAAKLERGLCGLEAGMMVVDMFERMKAAQAEGRFNLTDFAPDARIFADQLDARLGPKYANDIVRQTSMRIGTEVHDAIEWWFARKMHEAGDGPVVPGDPPIKTAEARRAFDRFVARAKELDVQHIASEVSGCSPAHRYSYRADHVCLIEGVATLVEIKSSDKFYIDDRMQTVAGRRGVSEYRPIVGVEDVPKAWLIRCGKDEDDAPFEEEWFEAGPDEDLIFETFLAALSLAYRWQAIEAAYPYVRGGKQVAA